MAKPWIVLEAPLATTPASDGTRGFAAALLRSGLRARIGAQTDAAGTELDEHSLEEGVRHHIEAGACPIVVGGDCCVALAARADGHEVSIADNGPGIPPDKREVVLGRRVRLDEARDIPGSGLGLSLVAAVTKLHGAQLRLEGAEPGLRVVLKFPT